MSLIGKKLITISFLLFSFCSFSSEIDKETFFKKYPAPCYQDIIIRDQMVSCGTDICSPRYNRIKPILDLYKKPFKILDLGAAQGYFSFRMAHDYPNCFCVMIDANTWYPDYRQHGDMLYDLCHLNSHLTNICYLNKVMTLSDLHFLSHNEHFDVVLALLVAHLMYDNLADQVKVIESLFSLGDNVIVEVAGEVAVPLTQYVEVLSKQVECQYLGEVRRHYDPNSSAIGKLYWFKRNKTENESTQNSGIKRETFLQLHGVYPENFI